MMIIFGVTLNGKAVNLMGVSLALDIYVNSKSQKITLEVLLNHVEY
jgi:hypothetical protein